MSDLLEKYLDDFDPADCFLTEHEARIFFSRENISYMFGSDQYDESEAKAALDELLSVVSFT